MQSIVGVFLERMIKAGKTDILVGSKIKTASKWGAVVTGTITHAFGQFGGTSYGAIAGIWIDAEYQQGRGETGNLFPGDFEVIGSPDVEQDDGPNF